MTAETARARVAGESWDAKAQLVADSILDLGLTFAPSAKAPTWSSALANLAAPKTASRG